MILPDPVAKEAFSLSREIYFLVKGEEVTVEASERNWESKEVLGSGGSGGWRRTKLPAVACDGIRPEARSEESQRLILFY